MSENAAANLLDYLTSEIGASLPARQETDQAIANMQALLDAPERGGGVTYSLYFGDQWGQPFYAVGLDNNLTRTAAPEELAPALNAFLRVHGHLLAYPRCCIGVWRSQEADGIDRA